MKKKKYYDELNLNFLFELVLLISFFNVSDQKHQSLDAEEFALLEIKLDKLTKNNKLSVNYAMNERLRVI